MAYQFADLIDIERLQELMSRLYSAAGIPVGIIGTDGTIYVATGWQEICTKFHRQHPITYERCRESDEYISRHLDEAPYAQYRCKNGLWDIAFPIRLRGEHLATLFVGQFHYEDDPPDRNFFISQAEECGFNKEEYLQALDELPVFSHEKMQAIVDYYLLFVNQLMDEGINRFERLAAEEELRITAQRLLLATSSGNLGVWDWDVIDDIMVWDDRMCELYGLTRDAFTGSSNAWVNGLHPEDRERAIAECQAALAGGKKYDTTFRVIHPDGTLKYLKADGIVTRDADGKAVRMIGINSDVTEHRIMQAELIKSQKLESLSVLAGGIAHDFNNILTGIMGNISFAKMILDESHEAYLPIAKAEKASLRAADLARQLLVFAKGGQPIKKPLSLHKVMNEAVSFALSGTNVTCSFDFPLPLHTVEADEGQINQVFHNIIINAVQAMPGGGNITVRGENVNLNDDNNKRLPAGDYVILTIVDEGCGISDADQKKVFDPYFSTKAGGSGLGLASTHSIIGKHGGHISVDSTVGVGTIFTIHLPSTRKIESDQSSLNGRQIFSHEGGSVLVMDDEEMVREFASLTLSRSGYRVKTCVNGDEAISLYRSAKEAGAPFSIVIMDLTIPGGMGGVEAAKCLLALDPEARLIVSSGYSDDPVMANYKAYGFCAAIEKPYKAADIAQILTEVDEGTS